MAQSISGMEGVLSALDALGSKRAGPIIKQATTSAGRSLRRLMKADTPRGRGRKKKDGSKRLSQSVSLKTTQRGGRYYSSVIWGGKKGLAGYANFLEFGAKKYTRRKATGPRKKRGEDEKKFKSRARPLGAVNVHNSRKGKRKGWAKAAFRMNSKRIRADLTKELEERILKNVNKLEKKLGLTQ